MDSVHPISEVYRFFERRENKWCEGKVFEAASPGALSFARHGFDPSRDPNHELSDDDRDFLMNFVAWDAREDEEVKGREMQLKRMGVLRARIDKTIKHIKPPSYAAAIFSHHILFSLFDARGEGFSECHPSRPPPPSTDKFFQLTLFAVCICAWNPTHQASTAT